MMRSTKPQRDLQTRRPKWKALPRVSQQGLVSWNAGAMSAGDQDAEPRARTLQCTNSCTSYSRDCQTGRQRQQQCSATRDVRATSRIIRETEPGWHSRCLWSSCLSADFSKLSTAGKRFVFQLLWQLSYSQSWPTSDKPPEHAQYPTQSQSMSERK